MAWPPWTGRSLRAPVGRARNTIGARAWFGPQPPVGHGDHHYYFWVYAFDAAVEGEPTREEFLDRYAGNILEQARMVATFSR
jgi:phosphatidylethanolamine-binding protein (PEBP) family uncharacterized protein